VLWSISHVLQVVCSWTTDIVVYYITQWLAALCIFLIYDQSVSHIVVETFSCFSYSYHIYLLWSLDIYSCKYYSIFSCFTNWLFFLFSTQALTKLQPKPSLISELWTIDFILFFIFAIFFSFLFYFSFTFI